MKKNIDFLLSLFSLCQREKEWGGRVNFSTGEVEGPVEGEEWSFSPGTTPEEEREKGRLGWAGFHSHHKGGMPEPSGLDFLVAHQRGTPEYVLTVQGVWEVKPVRVLPTKEVKELAENAWAYAEADEAETGDPAYWIWVGYIRKWLPVQVALIGKGGNEK